MAGRFTSATELTLEAHDRLDRLRETDIPAARDVLPDLARLLKDAAYPDAKSFSQYVKDSPGRTREFVEWREMSKESPGWTYKFEVRDPAWYLWNARGCMAAAVLVGVAVLAIWSTSDGPAGPALSLLLSPVAWVLLFIVPGATARLPAERLLRRLFAGRGPEKREEETAALTFSLFFAAAFNMAGAVATLILLVVLSRIGTGIATGVALCVAVAAGLSVGGYYAALELGMHARRREMLRDVIQRADDFLPGAGHASYDFDEGSNSADTKRDAAPNADPRASSSQSRSGPLPPHVTALARLCGYVAKRDGRVTPSEVASAETFVEAANLGDAGREAYVRAFNEGKSLSGIGFQIGVLKAHCGTDADLQYRIFDIVIRVAHADGHVSPEEAEVLEQVNRDLCDNLLDVPTLVETLNEDDPYAVLGLIPPCTRDEARKAYRKKAAEYHPDTLRHQKIPDEMRAFAEQRYRAVQEAYERMKGDLG